ncbi:HEAT repeat domain-containing protein [Gemmatimonadota bacterium]
MINQLRDTEEKIRDSVLQRIASESDRDACEILAEEAVPEDPRMEILFARFLQNVPPDRALPYLKKLIGSPNLSTRKQVFKTLEQLPSQYQSVLLLELLHYQEKDLKLYALERLGLQRQSSTIEDIANLLDSEDSELSAAAFSALGNIELRRALSRVQPFLESTDPALQVRALNTLGVTPHFKKWKNFLPALQSEHSAVRLAAVLNLSRKAGRKANKHLIDSLENEKDEEVTKQVLHRLVLNPDAKAVEVFIRAAAAHPEPGVQRAASWIIGELDEKLLFRTMINMLHSDSEEIKSYILTKMGQRQLPGGGKVIASYAGKNTPDSLRFAAFEGLGYLGKQKFLPVVEPYIRSDHPLEAYLGTLTAVKSIDRLEECPELIKLLKGPDENVETLKETVLQHMVHTLNWDSANTEILEILRKNLDSKVENISYISTILLGKSKNKELIPLLLSLVFNEPNPNIKEEAGTALDNILDGDLSFLLKLMAEKKVPSEIPTEFLALLSELRWNQNSAAKALEFFKDMKLDRDVPEIQESLDKIARILYAVSPEKVKSFFESPEPGSLWRLALGRAWLDSLQDLGDQSARNEWEKLFFDDDPRVVRKAIRRAVEAKAGWAVEEIVRRITENPESSLNSELRSAVKELLEL